MMKERDTKLPFISPLLNMYTTMDVVIYIYLFSHTHTHTSPYKKVLSAEAAILTYLVALSTIF